MTTFDERVDELLDDQAADDTPDFLAYLRDGMAPVSADERHWWDLHEDGDRGYSWSAALGSLVEQRDAALDRWHRNVVEPILAAQRGAPALGIEPRERVLAIGNPDRAPSFAMRMHEQASLYARGFERRELLGEWTFNRRGIEGDPSVTWQYERPGCDLEPNLGHPNSGSSGYSADRVLVDEVRPDALASLAEWWPRAMREVGEVWQEIAEQLMPQVAAMREQLGLVEPEPPMLAALRRKRQGEGSGPAPRRLDGRKGRR